MIFTFKDLTDHLEDYLSGSSEKDARDYRRAAVQALSELANIHPWSFYVTAGRLNVHGPYSEGTVGYSASSRTVSLTGGTFPSWAVDGVIDLDGFRSEVIDQPSATSLTLAPGNSPPSDIPAGTKYVLSRDSYLVPENWGRALTGLRIANSVYYGPEYVEPNQLRDDLRFTYTIAGSPNYQGRLAFRFDPPPNKDESYDYWYRRNPRDLRVEGYCEGTVSATQGSSSVSGSGTAFSGVHVGTIFRMSSNQDVPTGVAGDNVSELERVVLEVNSGTSLTLDGPLPETVSGRGYILSDPVDVSPYMLDALLRCAEYRLSTYRSKLDGISGLSREKVAAIQRSVASDNQSMGRRYCGRLDYFESFFDYGRRV